MTDKKHLKESQEKLRSKLAQKAFFNAPCASAKECTGITPTVPSDAEEAKSYTDIYDIPVTWKNKNKK